ncbi:MAG: glycosyltransferase [Verrucomicrobiales bacterium]
MNVIQTLWIGGPLRVVEQLCLNSFLFHGHQVHLYTYEPVGKVPEGVKVMDASEVMDPKWIFRYHRGGSVSGFTNWFRYELLYQRGGFWVDTDVICLKPFEFDQKIVAGWEDSDSLNGAVLGAQPGQDILKHLSETVRHPNKILPYDTLREKKRKWFRKYLKGNQRKHLKWGESGPKAVTRAMRHFGIIDQALPFTAFYPVHYKLWRFIFDNTFSNKMEYFKDSYALHIWNEAMGRDPSFDRKKDILAVEDSLFSKLHRKYMPVNA